MVKEGLMETELEELIKSNKSGQGKVVFFMCFDWKR